MWGAGVGLVWPMQNLLLFLPKKMLALDRHRARVANPCPLPVCVYGDRVSVRRESTAELHGEGDGFSSKQAVFPPTPTIISQNMAFAPKKPRHTSDAGRTYCILPSPFVLACVSFLSSQTTAEKRSFSCLPPVVLAYPPLALHPTPHHRAHKPAQRTNITN